MKQAVCIAVAHGDRINLVIKKEEDGYEMFAAVLNKIEKDGCMSWYGDVTDKNGHEQSGLVITCRPDKDSLK